MDALHYLPAHELLRRMADGQLSSEQLTRALLARIREHNPHLNAVVTLDEAGRPGTARQADRQRADGAPLGPLHGLPLTLKDTWEVAGLPCTAGAPALRDHRPERHARRGAATGGCRRPHPGQDQRAAVCHRPAELQRAVRRHPQPPRSGPDAGGSSGGAAAALAAGFTPLEVGSDLAGSIRTPAHFCGVFGHKPSRALVSFRGHIPGPPGTESRPDLVEGGPMARNARDLRLLLEVIAGPRPVESRSWRLAMGTGHDRPARSDPGRPLAGGPAVPGGR